MTHFKKFAVIGSLIVCGGAIAAAHSPVSVTLTAAQNAKSTGKIIFTQIDDKQVKVEGTLSGLTPGLHGMHVHMIGDCSDSVGDFKKSGGHFNPSSQHHGALSTEKSHAGDLGNITADAQGNAHFVITTNKFSLDESHKNNIFGKALVVHAGQDDEKTDPAGNSGSRILCGVIK